MINYPPIVPVLWFPTLQDALAPLSAGTEVKICVVSNCDSTTTTLIDVPHPTYLTNSGKAIVQLNMVELGGMNGLNS